MVEIPMTEVEIRLGIVESKVALVLKLLISLHIEIVLLVLFFGRTI